MADRSRGPIVFHASPSDTLPRSDDPESSPSVQAYRESREGEDEYMTREREDTSVGRVRTAYGYGTGLHFGTMGSATDRMTVHTGHPSDKNFIHPARIDTEITRRESDATANYDPDIDDKVFMGKAVPYRNNSEDAGSISYRVRPEYTKTWSEDVIDRHDSGRSVHPSMLAAAQQGYNPVAERSSVTNLSSQFAEKRGIPVPGKQPQLWDEELHVEGKPGFQVFRNDAGPDTRLPEAAFPLRRDGVPHRVVSTERAQRHALTQAMNDHAHKVWQSSPEEDYAFAERPFSPPNLNFGALHTDVPFRLRRPSQGA
jgi:hypothetical protein